MSKRGDGADEAKAPGRAGGRLLAAVALMVLAAFVAAVWYAYDKGVQEGATITPPLIRADPRPTKVRPDDPGGLVVPDQDKLIYQAIEGEAGPARAERLLPPPEQPVSPPAAITGEAVTVGEVRAVPPGGTAPVATPGGSGESSAPEPPPLPREPEEPMPEAAKAVAAIPRAQVEPASKQDPKQPVPATDGKGYRIQIAAYRDPDAATAGWAHLLRANPKLLSPLSPTVVKADLGAGRGIFYRLTAGPIADKDAAEALCQELKLKQVGCLVVEQ